VFSKTGTQTQGYSVKTSFAVFETKNLFPKQQPNREAPLENSQHHQSPRIVL